MPLPVLTTLGAGGSVMRKTHELTLFHGEGTINMNKLLIKINAVMNRKKVNKGKYNELKAYVRRIWPGWENPELPHWF